MARRKQRTIRLAGPAWNRLHALTKAGRPACGEEVGRWSHSLDVASGSVPDDIPARMADAKCRDKVGG